MTTAPPKFLSLENRYAVYRPHGEYTFEQTVDDINGALGFCRENDIGGLLVDIRQVTGFPSPSTMQRFGFATKWARTAEGKVALSMISRPEMIDPDKIGVTIAANRGLRTDVFTAEPDATEWLLKNLR